MERDLPPLYDRTFDHAACGLGLVARVDGHPSHEIVRDALQILHNLEHRGATGGDSETGDGAGIMLQIPDAFLRRECLEIGFELPPAGAYAVGTLFLSPDDDIRSHLQNEMAEIAAEEGQPLLGWREVPVRPEAIGRQARESMPRICQVFLARGTADEAEFTHALYRIRRRLHWVADGACGGGCCYVVSLSHTTLVYKGLLTGQQLEGFYPDLSACDLASAIGIVHSRFSTNTLGSWPLAHPYRYVAHNGEINALRGNLNWMRAREGELQRALMGDEEPGGPIVAPGGSDSSAFDNVLEALVLSGRTLPQAMVTMVPEAWENDTRMNAERRAFYEYASAFMAPWDGPACIAFSDGRVAGAMLDRNGLRPARYIVTRDGRVVLASEEGALQVPESEIVTRWRLGPGRMLLVDTVRGRLLADDEVKREVARSAPYQQRLQGTAVRLADLPAVPEDGDDDTPLDDLHAAFGYTLEDLRLLLPPMATTGKEADGSMGTDTPLAVLGSGDKPLFSYFKQLFAQVTNPPIDPLRESLVMSLRMLLGSSPSLVGGDGEHFRQIVLDEPILTDADLARIRAVEDPELRSVTLSTLFPVEIGLEAMEAALEALRTGACEAVESGASIVILSDRGVDEEWAAIPSLLATSSVHHALIEAGLRTQAGIVVETGDAREVHHMALLIGYGATAVCPWLALQTVPRLHEWGHVEAVENAQSNYRKALHAGLRKIISKMGISTLASYNGAQVFEAVGLGHEMVARHFTGTASRLGGIGLREVAEDVLSRHQRAFKRTPGDSVGLEVGGEYQLRHGGEYHAWNPKSIVALQRAVRTGRFETFAEFTGHFDEESGRSGFLRGLLDLEHDPIPLEEVEAEAEIVKRFVTGAMSHGSISKEAHETIAIAQNRIGGRSNTGEGGEAPERFHADANGDLRRSAVKQVASGRFGVTAHYLVNADVHQIKMAQGSKPGEGGQLPGHKVTPEIARLRFSTPGVGLISPPPHHDIYSIEDLAQLIHDLRCVNPKAEINVKLVSEVGVGTIAAGVAKARADAITISGYDGGTGASPLSSIKHAGLPWELGLAETQQVLLANGLRARVRLQVDGGLKTGRDVVIAGLLGAEEFAFSTAPLVATGCIMMRVCHLNTCPVGIATQDPVLRERFAGTPEHIVNYFFFLAREVRKLMADLGFRTFDDLVGRADRLRVRDTNASRAGKLDLTPLLWTPVPGTPMRWHGERQTADGVSALERDIVRKARPSLQERRRVTVGTEEEPLYIRNTDRTIGARLSGEIATRHGALGLPDDSVTVHLVGTAGQSFGAWAMHGVTLVLRGTANDYVGKGLSGGKLIVSPPEGAACPPERSAVIGNVALYGATAGEAYVRGMAGERFAVRNSGARAVVEGVGDHGCEYMTGGVVVVLGRTGRNFAAGMSGGLAFVYDPRRAFAETCNTESVSLVSVEDADDEALLKGLLKAHLALTGSPATAAILQNWQTSKAHFVRVLPNDLRQVLEEREAEAAADDLSEAV